MSNFTLEYFFRSSILKPFLLFHQSLVAWMNSWFFSAPKSNPTSIRLTPLCMFSTIKPFFIQLCLFPRKFHSHIVIAGQIHNRLCLLLLSPICAPTLSWTLLDLPFIKWKYKLSACLCSWKTKLLKIVYKFNTCKKFTFPISFTYRRIE